MIRLRNRFNGGSVGWDRWKSWRYVKQSRLWTWNWRRHPSRNWCWPWRPCWSVGWPSCWSICRSGNGFMSWRWCWPWCRRPCGSICWTWGWAIGGERCWPGGRIWTWPWSKRGVCDTVVCTTTVALSTKTSWHILQRVSLETNHSSQTLLELKRSSRPNG